MSKIIINNEGDEIRLDLTTEQEKLLNFLEDNDLLSEYIFITRIGDNSEWVTL